MFCSSTNYSQLPKQHHGFWLTIPLHCQPYPPKKKTSELDKHWEANWAFLFQNSKRQNVLKKSTEMGPTVAHRLPIMVQLRSFGSLSLNRKWCSSASLITLPHHVLFPSCWGWTSGSIRIRGATGAACLICLLLSSLASFCQPGRKLFWFFIDFWEWTNLWPKWHTFKTV